MFLFPNLLMRMKERIKEFEIYNGLVGKYSL